jgi:hypothetical protein
MKKIYRFHFLVPLTVIVGLLLGVQLLYQQYAENSIEKRLLFSSLGVILGLFISLSTKIQIDDNGITNLIPIIGVYRRKQWGDIHYIIDDYFFKFHFFYFSTSRNIWSLKDTLHTNNLFANYKDMIREVIYRVPPSCQVDEMFLKKAGLAKEDIGKLHKEFKNS